MPDPITDDATSQGLAATLAADSRPSRITAHSAETIPAVQADERYEPIGSIGRGGMGEVLLWRDRRVGRELAVKVPHAGLGDDARRRFAREALLQGRLEHPAFVPVYDVATDARGELYFTMRRVRGRTLRAILDDEASGGAKVPRHRLLATFTQLCLAIDYAHSRGVVHRDIKPENVMLGDFGEVYLLDWGVAKILDEAEKNTESLRAPGSALEKGTAHGSMLGTPGYMAPEQLRGENASLDGRADVYALGAVLFEILALQRMNAGETFGDVVVATLEGNGRSPSARAGERDIAPELDGVVLRATALERDERFASARLMADAIERYLEGDRDLASRRARAIELVRLATEKLDTAQGDPERRAEAGRDAARALAFDPAQDDARRVLLSVIGDAPPVPPREAIEAVEQARRAIESTTYGRSGWSVLGVNLVLTLLLAIIGVPELLRCAGPLVVTTIGGVVSLFFARRVKWTDSMGTANFAVVCLGNAWFSRLTGPFLAIPLAVGVTVITTTMYAPSRRRAERVILGCLALMVPFLLERVGLLAPTWIDHGTYAVIMSRMMRVAPSPWIFFIHGPLLVVAMVTGVFPLLDAARRTELREQSRAWMLRRVLASA